MEVFFSQLLKERDTLKQGAKTILGTQAKFLIFPPPNVKVRTHFKLIHTASVILTTFFVSIVLKAAPTTMKHKGNCPFARASRKPFIEIHKLEQ